MCSRFSVNYNGQRCRWGQHHPAQQEPEAGAGTAAESEQPPQLLLAVQYIYGGRHGVDAGKNVQGDT